MYAGNGEDGDSSAGKDSEVEEDTDEELEVKEGSAFLLRYNKKTREEHTAESRMR